MLANVMATHPLRQHTTARLQEQILFVWALWAKGLMSRHSLIVSLTAFVRGTCPEVINNNLVEEFKVRYSREFELQQQQQAKSKKFGGQEMQKVHSEAIKEEHKPRNRQGSCCLSVSRAPCLARELAYGEYWLSRTSASTRKKCFCVSWPAVPADSRASRGCNCNHRRSGGCG